MAWRRFVLVGLLLLAAAALCAWLGLGGPGGVPATDGALDPATPLAGDARPALTSSTDAGADREQPVLIGRVAPDEPLGSGEGGLFGRVLDARDGSAVPGVAVLAEAHYTARVGEKTNRVEQVLGTAVSDARGAYRLRLAQGGIVRILAVGGGWVNAKAAEEAFEWRSDRAWRSQRKVGRWVSHDVHVLPTGRVVGRVLHEDGRPAAGTRLRPRRRRVDPATEPSAYPWFAVPDAVCGADGSFVFDGLPRASHLLLEASLPGHPEAHAGPLDVVPGETTTVEIRLERRRIVRLHVVDAGTGEPIEAAAVRAWWTAPGCAPIDPMSSTNHPPVERHVATDVQGVALLLGPPAHALQVEVRAPDHLPFHSGPDAWNGLLRGLREDGGDVGLALARGAWIRGRLVLPGHIEPAWVRFVCRDLADTASETQVECDGDGTFRVLMPPEGRFVLDAYAHSYCWTVEGEHEVGAGETGVVFRPQILGQQRERTEEGDRPIWSFRLLGPDGTPLRKAYATLEGRGEIRPERAGRGGRFCAGGVVEVEPGYGEGVFCLCVSNGVAASDSDVGTGVFGPYRATDGHAEVRLPPARSLRGRVAGPGGKPVQGVEITARPRPPEGWTDPEDGYGTWTGPGVRGITDAEGRFELGGLGDMGYWIHAEALIGLRAPSPAWIPVGAQDETIELRMRRAMVYRVTLLGADGLPLARARVSVGAADGNLRVQFEADAQGVATLVDLDPQVVYELSVSDTFPYTSRHGSRSLAPRWTPRDETFKVEPGLAVAGVVVDAEGEPLRGALVFIERARGWVERDEADGAGRFSFWLPGPATVRLAAAFPERYDFGERPAEYPVRTTAGTTELVLRAVSRRDLTLTIDWGGAPETISCPVRLTRLDSTGDGRADTRLEHASRSRPLGFRDLEPGARYRLWSGALKDGWYLLADVSPADTSLPVQAQRGGEIEGRLLLPDGVGNASVGVYRPGVGIQAQASIEDGRFLLRGVPAGEWDLTARCATPTRRYGVTVKVRTGDRPTIDMTDALIDEDE